MSISRHAILSILAIASLFCVTRFADAALVAHYKLDDTGSSSALDSAGGGSASLINAARVTQGATGVFGDAFDFAPAGNGGGVNLGTSSAVQPAGAFTMTFWLNPDVLNDFDRLIESMDGTAATSHGFRIDMGGAPGNHVRALLRDGTGATNSLQTTATLSTGQYQFVAVRFDPASNLDVTVFNSGVSATGAVIGAATESQASVLPSGLNYQAGRPTVLGVETSAGTSNNAYNGRLDDVAFWDTVLTVHRSPSSRPRARASPPTRRPRA